VKQHFDAKQTNQREAVAGWPLSVAAFPSDLSRIYTESPLPLNILVEQN
jgi:hypothetical protein